MDALIATDRLVLRFVSAADVEDIQQCIGDPRIYRNVARISAHQTRDETEQWVSTHHNGRIAQTDYVYAVTLGEKLIGLSGLHRVTISDPFELGYWFSPSVWRRGYATETGQALLSALDLSFGTQKTVSGHFADNPASGRVLQKLGYVAVSKNSIYCAGRDQYVAHIVMERENLV